jgi:hypothetical protein
MMSSALSGTLKGSIELENFKTIIQVYDEISISYVQNTSPSESNPFTV